MMSRRSAESPVGRAVGSGEDLSGRVDKFLIHRMGLASHRPVIRETSPALTWNRLDLAIKLFYLEELVAGRGGFAEELYEAHIHAFSHGTFTEHGNPTKVGAAAFKESFQSVFRSIEELGFDPNQSLIPVANDGTILNGSHRVACAMLLGLPIRVLETGLPPLRYDYAFMRSRGMSDDLLDAAAICYAERSMSVRAALACPTSRSERAALRARMGPLVYRRELTLTDRGARNLRDQLVVRTDGERQTADEGKLNGMLSQAIRITLFLLEVDEGSCPVGPAASPAGDPLADHLHFTQSHAGALNLARLLLNQRGVQFLNYASPDRYPSTARLARFAGDALDGHGIPRELAILGPEMLLAACGLSEAGTAEVATPLPVESAATSDAVRLFHMTGGIWATLRDPRRHFHAWRLKFPAPDGLEPWPQAESGLRVRFEAVWPPRRSDWLTRPEGLAPHRLRFFSSLVRHFIAQGLDKVGLQRPLRQAYERLRSG